MNALTKCKQLPRVSRCDVREDIPRGSFPPGNSFPTGDEGNSGERRSSWPIIARLIASSHLKDKTGMQNYNKCVHAAQQYPVADLVGDLGVSWNPAFNTKYHNVCICWNPSLFLGMLFHSQIRHQLILWLYFRSKNNKPKCHRLCENMLGPPQSRRGLVKSVHTISSCNPPPSPPHHQLPRSATDTSPCVFTLKLTVSFPEDPQQ